MTEPEVRGRLRCSILGAAAAVAVAAACSGPPALERPGLEPSLLASSVTPPATRPPQRVFLISIGGLRPAHYRPHAVSCEEPNHARLMPTLFQLAEAGSSAEEVIPVTPAAVYPVHASLVTGVRPGTHKVVSDWGLNERGLLTGESRLAERLQGVTLWQAARAAQLPVAALAWPSTTGAAIDLSLPDVVRERPDESWLLALESQASPWILDRLKHLQPSLEEEGAWPPARVRDSLVTRLACDIASQEPTPALWLLRYQETGDAFVRYGPDSREARAALGRVDAELASLIGCLQARDLLRSSALVVVGDRPILPVHTRVDPNVVLMDAGLITPPVSDLVVGVHSWVAIAFPHGGSAVVYAEDEGAAVLARRALELAADDTRAFRVVSARELGELGADPLAWFGLEAAPGFVFGSGYSEPTLRAAEQRGAGGYLPGQTEGGVGFAAWGSGVRAGVRVPSMRQIDVAPTVAALLGLDLEGAEGRPLIGILSLGRSPLTVAPR